MAVQNAKRIKTSGAVSSMREAMSSLMRSNGRLASAMARVREMTPEQLAEAEARDKAEMAERIKCGIIAAVRRESRLESEDWNCTLTTFKPVSDPQKAAYKAIAEGIRLWPNERRSFYLWSADPGPGKSHLAKAYAIGVLDKGHSVVFWRSAEFKEAIFAAWRDFELEDPVEESKRRELIVLDDIEKANMDKNESVMSELWRLIDWRYDQRIPIVVTSQLPRDGQGTRGPSISSVFGPAFADRLADCIVLEVTGASGRRRI